MPDYAEITAWSLEEARAQANGALPEGWEIRTGQDEGHLWIQVVRPDEKVEWVVEWDSFHFDERTLYLNAFCWLWFREQPRPSRSVWAPRRGELTRKNVTQRILSSVADPEDLDPAEVRTVYEEARKKGR